MKQNVKDKNIFKPIDNTSRVEKLIYDIKTKILNKQLKPGDKLPTEMEMLKQLNVGRSTVREAITVLRAMGVVEIHRSKGTYISEAFNVKMFDPLFYSLMLSQDEIKFVKESSQWIDFSIISCVIRQNLIDKDQAVLTRRLAVLQESLKSDNIKNMINRDESFYSAIFKLSENPTLAQIAKNIHTITLEERNQMFQLMYQNHTMNVISESRSELLDIIINKKSDLLMKNILDDPTYH